MIVCDYSMPEMDGPSTVKQIRELHTKAGRAQPFIVCASAYEQDFIANAMLSAGVDKIYDKPLSLEQIEEIKDILAR